MTLKYRANEMAANTIPAETVKVYLTTITDEVLAKATITASLEADPTVVEATQHAGVVNIKCETLDGLANYSKTKGMASGAITLTWTPYSLSFDRGRQFAIDALDISREDGAIEASGTLARFVRQQVVPEVDKVRIAKTAAAAVTATHTEAYTPAAATILEKLEGAIDSVRDGSNIETGTTIFINRKYKGVLSKSTQMTAIRNIGEAGTALNTEIAELNGAQVIWAPDSYMHTEFTAAESGLTAGGSEIIALAVAPDCAQGVVSHQYSKIYETVPGFDGPVIDYRIFHDCFVPTNRAAGTYAITKTASGGS